MVLDAFRAKIHDVSTIGRNFQQCFTQWFNRLTERWGWLFGVAFDSILVGVDGAVARMMAYITLNPVREEMGVEPAEYKWCGYSERMTGWPLQADELPIAGAISRQFGLPPSALDGDSKVAMGGIWERFREMLFGAFDRLARC